MYVDQCMGWGRLNLFPLSITQTRKEMDSHRYHISFIWRSNKWTKVASPSPTQIPHKCLRNLVTNLREATFPRIWKFWHLFLKKITKYVYTNFPSLRPPVVESFGQNLVERKLKSYWIRSWVRSTLGYNRLRNWHKIPFLKEIFMIVKHWTLLTFSQ